MTLALAAEPVQSSSFIGPWGIGLLVMLLAFWGLLALLGSLSNVRRRMVGGFALVVASSLYVGMYPAWEIDAGWLGRQASTGLIFESGFVAFVIKALLFLSSLVALLVATDWMPLRIFSAPPDPAEMSDEADGLTESDAAARVASGTDKKPLRRPTLHVSPAASTAHGDSEEDDDGVETYDKPLPPWKPERSAGDSETSTERSTGYPTRSGRIFVPETDPFSAEDPSVPVISPQPQDEGGRTDDDAGGVDERQASPTSEEDADDVDSSVASDAEVDADDVTDADEVDEVTAAAQEDEGEAVEGEDDDEEEDDGYAEGEYDDEWDEEEDEEEEGYDEEEAEYDESFAESEVGDDATGEDDEDEEVALAEADDSVGADADEESDVEPTVVSGEDDASVADAPPPTGQAEQESAADEEGEFATNWSRFRRQVAPDRNAEEPEETADSAVSVPPPVNEDPSDEMNAAEEAETPSEASEAAETAEVEATESSDEAPAAEEGVMAAAAAGGTAKEQIPRTDADSGEQAVAKKPSSRHKGASKSRFLGGTGFKGSLSPRRKSKSPTGHAAPAKPKPSPERSATEETKSAMNNEVWSDVESSGVAVEERPVDVAAPEPSISDPSISDEVPAESADASVSTATQTEESDTRVASPSTKPSRKSTRADQGGDDDDEEWEDEEDEEEDWEDGDEEWDDDEEADEDWDEDDDEDWEEEEEGDDYDEDDDEEDEDFADQTKSSNVAPAETNPAETPVAPPAVAADEGVARELPSEQVVAIVASVDEAERETFLRSVQLLLETDSISLSRLQRELGVTYYTAARVFEILEREKMISPYSGTLAREIHLDRDDWEAYFHQRSMSAAG